MALRWQTPDVDTFDELDDGPTCGTPEAAGLALLLDLLNGRRPAWQADALCLEHPDLPWFPERGEDTRPCKAVCARCSCAQECRSYAEAEGIRFGVWGGANVASRTRKASPAA